MAAERMEIVDVEYRRERGGAVVRFFLDREGGVSLDDLSGLSRRLGDVLEGRHLVPGPYTLEVSSPGINRRLRDPEHFRRYVGCRVKVRSRTILAGRRSFLGILEKVCENGILLEVDGEDQFIGFDQIQRANYEHDFGDRAKIKPGHGPGSG